MRLHPRQVNIIQYHTVGKYKIGLRHQPRAYIHMESLPGQHRRGVTWYGWARNWNVKGGPRFDSLGSCPFWGVSFKWDRLDRLDSKLGLGLINFFFSFLFVLQESQRSRETLYLLPVCTYEKCSTAWHRHMTERLPILPVGLLPCCTVTLLISCCQFVLMRSVQQGGIEPFPINWLAGLLPFCAAIWTDMCCQSLPMRSVQQCGIETWPVRLTDRNNKSLAWCWRWWQPSCAASDESDHRYAGSPLLYTAHFSLTWWNTKNQYVIIWCEEQRFLQSWSKNFLDWIFLSANWAHHFVVLPYQIKRQYLEI